jgi:peptidoglycan/LPS O-acetylase OafA/YrhL
MGAREEFPMPLLQSSIKVLEKYLPKVISPQAHAIANYACAAVFFGAAFLFWRKNKRAAIASLVCGAAEAGVAAMTDSPGGATHAISFPLHRNIALGLSSMTAAMPEFLAFKDEKEKAFFRAQSAVIAGLTALTDFAPQELAGVQEREAA